MKQKTKPIFGLLFVLTMALGMVLMMPTKALAAETITTLTLTGLTKPVAGEYPSIDGVSLGEQMEIQEDTRWLIWDGERYTDEFDDKEPFEEGKKYALRIVAQSADGYELSPDLKVIFNGNELPDSDINLPYYRSDKFIYENILAVGIIPEDMLYDITVTDGKATIATREVDVAVEGTEVTITADAPAEGKIFDKWEVVSGSVTFADATSATTTFTMPDGAVTVKALFKCNHQLTEHPEVPADFTSDGIHRYWSCSACGMKFSDEEGTVPVTDAELVIPRLDYQIINGAESSWVKGSGEGLTIRGNGNFSNFTGVKVDGNLLDQNNYTAKEGSTIITLSISYLNTLATGNHSVEILWTDGSASTSFTIDVNASGNDNGNPDNSTFPSVTGNDAFSSVTGNEGNNSDSDNDDSNPDDSALPSGVGKKDEVPKTGDGTPTEWLLILAGLSGTGLILIGKKGKKNLET